jgi:hypothetical protein
VTKLRVKVSEQTSTGHGERFTVVIVRTEVSRYGLYESTPEDRARAETDAACINGLIEADEKRHADEPPGEAE